MKDETFRIRLEAKNPEKGHLRAYRIDAGQDLFGQWNIEVTFGRIGRRGRSVTYSAADDAGAAAIVRHVCTAGPARRNASEFSIRSGSCAIQRNGPM